MTGLKQPIKLIVISVIIGFIRVEVRGGDEVARETGLTLLTLFTLVHLLYVVSGCCRHRDLQHVVQIGLFLRVS